MKRGITCPLADTKGRGGTINGTCERCRLGAMKTFWGELLRRIFTIDVFTSNTCSGRRRIISPITECAVATNFLDHVGLSAYVPVVLPARAPCLPGHFGGKALPFRGRAGRRQNRIDSSDLWNTVPNILDEQVHDILLATRAGGLVFLNDECTVRIGAGNKTVRSAPRSNPADIFLRDPSVRLVAPGNGPAARAQGRK